MTTPPLPAVAIPPSTYEPKGRVVTKHRFPLAFAIYMLLLAAVIPAALLTWAYAGFDAAMIVSQGGTTLVILGTLAYAAVWHSRSRWPEVSAWRRLHNILTFTR